MQYFVYILESLVSHGYYCGQTNDIIKRLRRHNSGEMQSTKAYRPWKLIGYVCFDNRTLAVQLETRIKSRGIERWLRENYHLLVQPR